MERKIHGVLPDHQIKQLIENGTLVGAMESRIQPASIDLVPDLNTLMTLKKFTLPRKGECIQKGLIKELLHWGIAQKAKDLTLHMQTHSIVRLKEHIHTLDYFARANPKSSIGRIFTHTRLLCDGVPTIDEIPHGYSGELWMLVTPKFSSVTLSEHESLNQLRFFSGDARLSEHELRRELQNNPDIVSMPKDMLSEHIEVVGNTIGEIPISVDLKGKCYRTRLTKRPLGLNERNIPFDHYYELIDPEEIVHGLSMELNRGYLIGTMELFQVPENMAMEVIVSDKFGEIKLHFAGFVDPKFGLHASHVGNSITLEIVAHEPGYYLRHGQYVGNTRWEWMTTPPLKGYEGNYVLQGAGAKLPKYLT